jgi:hypothetical protein
MSSIQEQNKYSKNQPYHIYYDLDFVNNNTSGNNAPAVLSFSDIRNTPYLNCPENYFMSVVRFNLQSPSLPVFIPNTLIGQSNINKLAYSFSMTYKSYVSQTYIIYVPTDTTQPNPNPPTITQDLTSGYYYIYSYQEWFKMINTALSTCFNALSVLAIAGGDALPSSNPPFMVIDPNSLTATLNADINGFNNTLANPIKIYMNTAMFNLYNNFPAYRYSDNNINGLNYLFDIYNNNNTNTLIISSTYSALVMFQEQSTCALLNPIQSIIFTTGQLPVTPSLSSLPYAVNGGVSQTLQSGNNSNISPQISDFEVPFSALNTYKPNITYVPSAEYRLIDMYGNSPINQIQINVLWKDFYGNIKPFYLLAGCCSNLKIMFRRKDYNNSNIFD